MVYQPKFQHDKMISCEALIRPTHCKNVEEYIKNHSNPCELDTKVIKHVLGEIKTHQPEFNIAVNVSSSSLADSETIQSWIDIIGDAPLSLELTEHGQTFQTDTITNNIETLKENGIFVALDDFGKGNAHSILLANTHFDEVKIDRCYIENIGKSTRHFNHLKHLTNFILNIGFDNIVYEGVENISQHRLIREINNNAIVQGYLLQRPTSIADTIRIWNSNIKQHNVNKPKRPYLSKMSKLINVQN